MTSRGRIGHDVDRSAPGEARSQTRPLLRWLGVPLTVAVLLFGAVALLAARTPRDSSSEAIAGFDPEMAPASIAEHYRSAAANPDVYQQIPCYCGCEDFLAHRHLYDCFVRADGEGWEAHASGCGICIAESQTARPLIADGQPPAAIRDAVVERYGSTPPTTPIN